MRWKSGNTGRRMFQRISGAVAVAGLLGMLLFAADRKQDVMNILYIYQATDQDLLCGVQVEWIPGYDNPDGKAFYQEVADNGVINCRIPAGKYTLKWSLGGNYEGYSNLTAEGEVASLGKYLSPQVEGDFTYILAEWDGETDIDLCVYSEEKGRCIGQEALMSENGSLSYGDNDRRYELVRLMDYTAGNFSVYLKDCGVLPGEEMPDIPEGEVTVSVYTQEGMIYQIKAQTGWTAELWNCFDLCGGRVEERDEYIHDLTEYTWAARDKNDPASWVEELHMTQKEEYNILGTYEDKTPYILSIWIYEYDEEGNEVSQTEYSMMQEDDEERYGSPFEIYHYNEYDKNGGLTREVYYEPFKGYEAEYNENGDLAERRFYNPAGLESAYRYEYQYDGNNRVTVCDCYYDDERTRLYSEEKYEYDEYGNMTYYYLEERTDHVWIREEEYEYEYDLDGNVLGYVRNRHFSDSQREDEWYECRYDENGNLVTDESWDGYRRYSNKLEYDENGNLTGYYSYMDGASTGYEEYEYDENGVMRARYCYFPKGTLDYREEYDEVGNRTAMYAQGEHLSDRYEYAYDAYAGMVTIYHYSPREENMLVLIRKEILIYN